MNEPGAWQLRFDLFIAHVLLFTVNARGNMTLRPEVHLYFADRYRRLAFHYHRQGNERKAVSLLEKSRRHFQLGGGNEPPPPIAVAMTVPRRPSFIEAIGMWEERPPPDNAA